MKNGKMNFEHILDTPSNAKARIKRKLCPVYKVPWL